MAVNNQQKKCIFFLDSLYNVFHCSYNFKLCSICPGGREAIILLSIGNPNFRRLFPPGILLFLYFSSNDSYTAKSIYLHEHFLMKKHMYQSNEVFGSYMELIIAQKLHFFIHYYHYYYIFFQMTCYVLCFLKIALVFHSKILSIT